MLKNKNLRYISKTNVSIGPIARSFATPMKKGKNGIEVNDELLMCTNQNIEKAFTPQSQKQEQKQEV